MASSSVTLPSLVEGFLVDLLQFKGLARLHADVVPDHQAEP